LKTPAASVYAGDSAAKPLERTPEVA